MLDRDQPCIWLAEVSGRSVGIVTVDLPPHSDWIAGRTSATPAAYLGLGGVRSDIHGAGIGSPSSATSTANSTPPASPSRSGSTASPIPAPCHSGPSTATVHPGPAGTAAPPSTSDRAAAWHGHAYLPDSAFTMGAAASNSRSDTTK